MRENRVGHSRGEPLCARAPAVDANPDAIEVRTARRLPQPIRERVEHRLREAIGIGQLRVTVHAQGADAEQRSRHGLPLPSPPPARVASARCEMP